MKTIRLGSSYRTGFLSRFLPGQPVPSALDIGCHDGQFLSLIDAPFRVGVDLELEQPLPTARYALADGTALPFATGSFFLVTALDVLEHVRDDSALCREIVRVTQPGGTIVCTTPSDQFRIFPSVLTARLHRAWGHVLRTGYSQERLRELFYGMEAAVVDWNAGWWRLLYFPMRALHALSPAISSQVVRWAAAMDGRKTQGEHGYRLVILRKPERSGRNA